MVTCEQLEDRDFERKVAGALAEIHVIPVPDDMPRNWEAKEGIQRCLNDLPQRIPDPEVDKWYQATFAGMSTACCFTN